MDASAGKPSQTVAEAASLLRRLADEADEWANETAKLHGEHSVESERHRAVWFRTAANVIESGEYRGFGYGPQEEDGSGLAFPD